MTHVKHLIVKLFYTLNITYFLILTSNKRIIVREEIDFFNYNYFIKGKKEDMEKQIKDFKPLLMPYLSCFIFWRVRRMKNLININKNSNWLLSTSTEDHLINSRYPPNTNFLKDRRAIFDLIFCAVYVLISLNFTFIFIF